MDFMLISAVGVYGFFLQDEINKIIKDLKNIKLPAFIRFGVKKKHPIQKRKDFTVCLNYEMIEEN